jgi:hypothetical protein
MPDTTAYLILALVVTFGATLLYVGSLVWRQRRLAQDEAVLDQLREE